jgi:hypothetical protein
MTPRDRQIINLYNRDELTFSEIGEMFSISKQRVQQIFVANRGKVPPLPVPSTEPDYDWDAINRGIQRGLFGR